jgi:hypothetical protein
MKMIKPMEQLIVLLGFLLAILIISAVVQALWSLSGLLGLLFLFLTAYSVLMKGGNITVARNQPYLIFLCLGLFFLFLSYVAGVQIVDLSGTMNPLEALLPMLP